MSENIIGKMQIIIVMFMVVTVLFIFVFVSEHKARDVYEDVKNKIDSGYSVYVNGTEVESDKIAVEKYPSDCYTIKDDENIILITIR